jgi:hypothetical protein
MGSILDKNKGRFYQTEQNVIPYLLFFHCLDAVIPDLDQV